jgi:hypothetical protein
MNKCSLLLALLYLENEIAKQVQSQNAFFQSPYLPMGVKGD